MATKVFHYSTTISVSYAVEIPDGMDPDDVLYELMDSAFSADILSDLSEADFGGIEMDSDDCELGFVDLTAEDVLHYIG